MLLNTSISEANYINEGIRRNDIYMIDEALNRGGIIVNDAEYIQETSLGMAITYERSIELVNLLLSKGAEIKTEYRINHSPPTIHEYNHLHLAILYRRADIVQMFLKQGTKIVKDIPFFKIIEGLNKVTKLYGVCSFFEDDKSNTVYAETELCSHGILTTLNIAFGVRDPKIIQLILQHDKNSFIEHIQDDGTIPHPEFDLQNEYFTYHPYHKNYSDDPDKLFSYAGSIRHIDNLNIMNVNYLNHYIVDAINRIPDERIGLLKRYIDTPSRIAYMIILCCLQPTDQCKLGILELIAKCINQLEPNNMISSVNTLLKDGIVSRLPHNQQCSEGMKDEILAYTKSIFSCAEKVSDSMKIFNQEAKKIQEAVSTTLTEIGVQNISVQADVWICKHNR